MNEASVQQRQNVDVFAVAAHTASSAAEQKKRDKEKAQEYGDWDKKLPGVAHYGGRSCRFPHCNKAISEAVNTYCSAHFDIGQKLDRTKDNAKRKKLIDDFFTLPADPVLKKEAKKLRRQRHKQSKRAAISRAALASGDSENFMRLRTLEKLRHW